jgi:phage baseplate assembly protein W
MTPDAGQIFGRGIAFPPHLDQTGQWAFSSASDNVRESIRVILLTEPGERIMVPDFGAKLRSFLFQPNTVTTRRSIQDEIGRALQQWEQRVQLDSVDVKADASDPQAVVATINYTLVANQSPGQIALSMQLQG